MATVTEDPLPNGHSNHFGNGSITIGGLTNGISSTDETDQQSETSFSSAKRSSEGSLRGLPPIPKEEADPPLLPSNPPRNIEKLPPRMRPRNLQNGPKFIPEKEITIPNDGNISGFSTEDMTTFFKHMGLSDRIVNHLNKKSVDGKRFSKFKDSDLDTIGINNPILRHFRDKSASAPKKRVPFML